MSKWSRRHVLRLSAIIPFSSLAGCVSSGTDPIDIQATNGDTTTHTITITVKGDFTPIAKAESLVSGETETLTDMIPILDYNHTFTIEVNVDGTVVSTTRHVIGDITSGDKPVPLRITDSDGVSLDIPELSPTPRN